MTAVVPLSETAVVETLDTPDGPFTLLEVDGAVLASEK